MENNIRKRHIEILMDLHENEILNIDTPVSETDNVHFTRLLKYEYVVVKQVKTPVKTFLAYFITDAGKEFLNSMVV